MQPNEYPERPDDANSPPQPEVGISSVRRVLQPLSSEADILASAAAVRTAPSEPAVQPGLTSEATTYSPSSSTEMATQPYADDSTSRLITEPIIKPQQPQLYPRPVTPVPQEPRKKSHKLRNGILIALLVIGVSGGYYLYSLMGFVTTADLVETEVDDTTYLRPKQWEKLDGSFGDGYGNKLGRDGKSSALIVVNRNSTQNTALASMPDNMLDMVRQSALNSLTDASLEVAFKGSQSGCNTVSNIQKEPDDRSVGSTIGIYKLTADCSRDDGTFNISMKGMIGKDGYFRTVGIVAEKSNWERNKEAYQKMLDSVQQKDGSA